MKRINLRSLSFIRTSMVILNYFIILFYASVILFGTKHIVSNQTARQFLDDINYIPKNPVKIFLSSMILFGVLTFIIYNRNDKIVQNRKLNVLYNIIEILVCFIIIMNLYMGYSGIVLLVFCDCIFHLKDDKFTKWMLGILVVIYFVANYDIFSMFVNMPNSSAYFDVFEGGIKGVLLISNNLFVTSNLVLFILFMILYISEQIQETENIAKELDMIHQVNKNLQHYAEVTEKIGENNERKRLAREIHDTLGHALTGIAAGIDACIAMIDRSPKETKKQLYVISKVVRQGIGDVRNSLNKLRPGALEEQGLKGAIENMIAEFSSISNLTIRLDYNLDNIDFEKTKEDIIFRIIQEGITNALRHGGAENVIIRLSIEENVLMLKLLDDGKGCEKIQLGYGLKQMQERVATIYGKVSFDGSKGFLIEALIPIQRGEKYD